MAELYLFDANFETRVKSSATFLYGVNFWFHPMAGKEKSMLRQDIEFWYKFCSGISPSPPQPRSRGTACCPQACGSDAFSCFPPYFLGCRTASGTVLEMCPGWCKGWRGRFLGSPKAHITLGKESFWRNVKRYFFFFFKYLETLKKDVSLWSQLKKTLFWG